MLVSSNGEILAKGQRLATDLEQIGKPSYRKLAVFGCWPITAKEWAFEQITKQPWDGFGLVFLGLVNGILEDPMFITIMVPYTSMSVDLTGESVLDRYGSCSPTRFGDNRNAGLVFLGLSQPHRLAAFWAVGNG